MKYRILVFVLLVVFFLGFLVYQYATLHDGKLHIVFCNIGQGDGIYIRTPQGTDMVIDAGPNNTILDCLGRHMPLWDRSIELAFATHPDADHIGGFRYILESYQVKSFNTSQKTNDTRLFTQLYALLQQKQVPVRYLYQGDTFTTSDGVEVKDFWPTHAYVDTSSTDADTNSFSLVQLLTYRNFKTLFTGDIESEILDEIFANGLDVDVFKIPHHGSKTGVDASTFQKIHEQFVPISVGSHNRYHHPNVNVLELLKQYKVSYQRTDQVGDIEVISDGNGFVVKDVK